MITKRPQNGSLKSISLQTANSNWNFLWERWLLEFLLGTLPCGNVGSFSKLPTQTGIPCGNVGFLTLFGVWR